MLRPFVEFFSCVYLTSRRSVTSVLSLCPKALHLVVLSRANMPNPGREKYVAKMWDTISEKRLRMTGLPGMYKIKERG